MGSLADKLPDDWCGCDTRRETIGEDKFFAGCILAGAFLILALTHGGNVTKQTKNMLGIAAAGAILALIADKVVNPTLK